MIHFIKHKRCDSTVVTLCFLLYSTSELSVAEDTRLNITREDKQFECQARPTTNLAGIIGFNINSQLDNCIDGKNIDNKANVSVDSTYFGQSLADKSFREQALTTSMPLIHFQSAFNKSKHEAELFRIFKPANTPQLNTVRGYTTRIK